MEKEKREFEEKLLKQQEELQSKKREQEMLESTPHIQNINSDPSMTGMVKKAFYDGENTIGRETKDYSPNLVISGVGIANRHCIIVYDSSTRSATVSPNSEDPNKFQIKVNGNLLTSDPVSL